MFFMPERFKAQASLVTMSKRKSGDGGSKGSRSKRVKEEIKALDGADELAAQIGLFRTWLQLVLKKYIGAVQGATA